MDKPSVLLVNGNSSPAVTDRLAGLAQRAAPQIDFWPYTPEGGPVYVSTPADVVAATPKVVETIARAVHERGREPDGCLIACFGEPGLLEARRRYTFPIVGMAEASMLTAMQLGEKFAILTLGEHWPTMLQDLVKLYGVQDRCAGITRVAGTPLDLLNNPAQAAKSVAAAARDCGSPTVIIGGAALTGLAATIGPLPGIQLIDCLLASVAQMSALTTYRRMAHTASERQKGDEAGHPDPRTSPP